MKKNFFNKITAAVLALICAGGTAVSVTVTAHATSLSGAGILGGGVINGNDGSSTIVSTQFVHDEYIDSWLRDLIVKEDITTINSLATRCTLEPVTDYPYTHTPDTFKSEVKQYVELYTLDDDSRKAAYIYLFKQFNALSVISEPNVTDEDKVAWLTAHGIVVPSTVYTDPTEMLMAGALYSLMRNDLYYVYTGKHVDIPEGTPMETALMTYLMAFSNNNTNSNVNIGAFLTKYFGNVSVDSLDKYVYYTALFALFTRGLVSVSELAVIPAEEVYRRLAIMSITDAGISIDASSASTEELRLKYLAAMLSQCYNVKIDPNTLQTALDNGNVHLYLVRLMAYQDAGLTISDKYSYTEAFNLMIKSTSRFALDNDFYSDIYEYNIHLSTRRNTVYVRPTAIKAADTSAGTTLSIALEDGTAVQNDSYSNPLKIAGKMPDKYNLIVSYTRADGTVSRSTYRLNIYQGEGVPPTEIGVTDIVSIVFTGIGDIILPDNSDATTEPDGSSPPRGGAGNLDDLLSLPEQLLKIANKAAESGLGPVVSALNNETVTSSGDMYAAYLDELLPSGYEYATDKYGKLIIIPVADYSPSTSETKEEGYAGTVIRFDNTDIILAAVILLCIIAFAVLIISKKRAKNRRMRRSRKKSGRKKFSPREFIKQRQRRV